MRSVLYFISLFIVAVVLTNCAKDGSADAAASATGKGGSLARFTVVNNHLYLADRSSIEVYDISNPGNPVFKSSINVTWNVETIFPFKNQLFIGSTDGMFIYSLANPDAPVKLGEARHLRSCDPVVANDTMAYVTLRGSGACGPAVSGLYTYDIRNPSTPIQKSLKELSNPYGLGLKDSVVFVCRGHEGLTAINVKDPVRPRDMYTITNGNYMDVIPYDDVLICYLTTGLVLYDMSNLNQLRQIGNINY
jgi:hypothetical protein